MCTRERTPTSTRLRVLLPCGAEEALVGEEHDYPLGAVVELLPVRLRRELLEVFANLPSVIVQLLLPYLVVGCLLRVEICGEGDLCIDDDLFPTRQAHDQVRPEPAVLGRGRDLLDEVAVRKHPGDLDDSLELNLAPAPPRVGRTQRIREGGRLLTERGQVPAELAESLRPSLVQLLNSFADCS